MGSKNRRRKNEFFTDRFWQSDNYNFRNYHKNLDLLLSLAINRFRWEGLPETCDARYLEKILHRNGIATLSFKADEPVQVFTTLQAMPTGEYNMYGLPTKWRAVGYDGLTDYECKGYGSAEHIAAIKEYGPTPIHRRSFIKNFID